VVARAIHTANPRGAFVTIDCGSLVGSLMESELFGHIKGAFSGATENKKGLVEAADGGTAFFDEIGDLPLDMQVKLLRLMQEREFRPVGGLQWKKVDLRVIAATHRDLKSEVAAGRFRLDLYYRLNVLPVRLPALRDRKEDVQLLAEHFAGDPLIPDVLQTFLAYDWPGNVRELKHCVERMIVLRSEGALRAADMPTDLRCFVREHDIQPLPVVEEDRAAELPVYSRSPSPHPVISIPDSERQAISAALAATNGERGRTAKLLKISRTTLYRRMKEYKLD
jgi:DNA-binding NtrC family response regulator